MIGKLLGHTNVHMTARYAHLANDPLKSAANRIAEVSGQSKPRTGLHFRRLQAPTDEPSTPGDPDRQSSAGHAISPQSRR